MKKLLIVLLISLLALVNVSCSKQVETDNVSTEQTETANAPEKETAAEKSVEPTSDDKTQVADKKTQNEKSSEPVAKTPEKTTTEVKQEPDPIVTHAPSSNKTVVTADNAPSVFWAMDTLYHLDGCKSLEGKEFQQISWSVVEQVMLRQCPVCNPPQYKGYVENDE